MGPQDATAAGTWLIGELATRKNIEFARQHALCAAE